MSFRSLRQTIETVLLASLIAILPSLARAEGQQVLDGEEKSILVVGYSTSYVWPFMLQELLDAHAGGTRTYHVLNAVIGGAPVDHWNSEPGSPNYERTMGVMIRDYFGADARIRGRAPEPHIAIAQQSLQLTLDDRGPVKSAHDMVGAELGADELEKMAFRLNKLGIEDLWIAMHIYKEPVEPEVGNERIALGRLLTRGIDFIHQGPDIWAVTEACFPDCFIDDRLHPNEQGYKLAAEHWYRTLAGDDVNEAAIAALHSREYEWRPMMEAYLATRRVAE